MSGPEQDPATQSVALALRRDELEGRGQTVEAQYNTLEEEREALIARKQGLLARRTDLMIRWSAVSQHWPLAEPEARQLRDDASSLQAQWTELDERGETFRARYRAVQSGAESSLLSGADGAIHNANRQENAAAELAWSRQLQDFIEQQAEATSSDDLRPRSDRQRVEVALRWCREFEEWNREWQDYINAVTSRNVVARKSNEDREQYLSDVREWRLENRRFVNDHVITDSLKRRVIGAINAELRPLGRLALGRAFELFCVDLLEQSGYEVIAQGGGDDRGIDLILNATSQSGARFRIGAQVKFRGAPGALVGENDVHTFGGKAERQGIFDRLLMITAGGFSEAAAEEAAWRRIEMWDGLVLLGLMVETGVGILEHRIEEAREVQLDPAYWSRLKERANEELPRPASP